MANTNAAYTRSGTTTTFTGGTAASPVTGLGFVNSTGPAPAVFDSTANSFAAIQSGDKGSFLVSNCYADLSGATIVLSNSATANGWFIFGSSGTTVVSSDTVATIITDWGAAPGDALTEILAEDATLTVAEGGRIRYAISNYPYDNTEVQTDYAHRLKNTEPNSQIRMTIDMGSFAIGEDAWSEEVSDNVYNKLTDEPADGVAAKRLASSRCDYEISSAVQVRDILYRGDWVDWRPGATGTWAPLTGGGFVSRYGLKWLPGALQSHTTPIIFGNTTEEFNIEIEFDKIGTPYGEGVGFWEYGFFGPDNNINRNIFRNFNGIDWETRLGLYVATANETTSTSIENHVYPTVIAQNENLAVLPGTKVKVNSKLPDYTGGTQAVAVALLETSTLNCSSQAYTGADGSALLGLPAAALTQNPAADVATDAPIITQVVTRVGRNGANYLLSSADQVGYDSNLTQTYDMWRMGQQIVFGASVFSASDTAGNGLVDLGAVTLPVDNDVSIVIFEDDIVLTSASTTLTLTNGSDVLTAEVYLDGVLIPYTSISSGANATITFPSALAVGTYTVLAYAFPTTLVNLDDLYDRMYQNSVEDEQDYIATQTSAGVLDFGTQDVVLNAVAGNATITRNAAQTLVTVRLGNGVVGTLEEGSIFQSIKAGGLDLEDTIKFGVDVGTGDIEFNDGVFTDSDVIDTTENVRGKMILPAGNYNFRNCDTTGLSVQGPALPDVANITLINTTGTLPTVFGGTSVQFLETATLTVDFDEAYLAANLDGFSAYTATGTPLVYTKITTIPDPVTSGNTATWTFPINAGETLYWAIAYRGKEILAGNGNSSSATLVDIPTSFLNYSPTPALTAAESAFIAGMVSNSTLSIQFRTPGGAIETNVAAAGLSDGAARLAIRQALELQNTMDGIAQGTIDDDEITFNLTGIVVKDTSKVNIQKTTASDNVLAFHTQALDTALEDAKASISPQDNVRLEVRFDGKANVVFTTSTTFDFVTDEVKTQNAALQTNLNTAFKGQL